MAGVAHGIAADPFAPPPVDAQWELHNLSTDPEERTNLAGDAAASSIRAQLETVLERTREEMRRTPQHVNVPA